MHYGKTSKTHAEARTATAGHAGISHAADAGTPHAHALHAAHA
ncbi:MULTISPECIES: hypothetical protein [Thermoactinomyces]|nr:MULTISPECIES: hypothetical protein [Thermoactinomyces]